MSHVFLTLLNMFVDDIGSKLSDKLQKLQCSVARIITSCSSYDACNI